MEKSSYYTNKIENKLLSGGWQGASSHAGASNVAGVSAERKTTDEEYARELLDIKLENKG